MPAQRIKVQVKGGLEDQRGNEQGQDQVRCQPGLDPCAKRQGQPGQDQPDRRRNAEASPGNNHQGDDDEHLED